MPFGHKAGPTKNYRFGCMAPATNEDLVLLHMRKAHDFRNKLVDLEHLRRHKANAVIREFAARLLELDALILPLEEARELAVTAISQVKARDRIGKVPAKHPTRVALKEIKDQLAPLYEEHKALRKETYAREDVQTALEAVEAWHLKRVKYHRALSGLHWGNYNHVIQSMSSARSGAPPVFMRLVRRRTSVHPTAKWCTTCRDIQAKRARLD